MAERKTRVLCYTDHDNGRDVEMILPIRFFAERFLNCTFQHAFVYDEHAIYRYKPDLVLLPSTVGSHMYYDIARYALDQKIPVFALDSEGNFRTDGSFDYWGYNKDRRILQNYLCLWSMRVVNFMRQELPNDKDKIVLTGATGFDRYKIYRFRKKEEYLKEHNKRNFTKVVGYAAWAFGKLYFEKGVQSLIAYLKGDESKLNEIETERQLVSAILKETIVRNPDVLFILKKHPSERRPTETGYHENEIDGLTGFENVIFEGEEAKIHDLLNVCDLWLTYESTTAIEAWLLGKTTILIRPRANFMGQITDKKLDISQVVVHSHESLNNAIKEYFEQGSIREFEDARTQSARNEVIWNSIGFGDGKNHIRAAYYFEKSIKNIAPDKIRLKFNLKYFVRYLLIKAGIFFYIPQLYAILPKTKKFIWVFEQYSLARLKNSYELYVPFLEEFYAREKIEEKYYGDILYRDLISKSTFEKN